LKLVLLLVATLLGPIAWVPWWKQMEASC
jgi:hypothetical protein